MNEVAIFTIASRNYIPYVRVLMDSIRKFHVDVDLHLLLADEGATGLCDREAGFSITEAKAIGIPDFIRLAFTYNIIEFNTAIKPFFIRHLMSKGYKKVVYLDPDILLLHNLKELFTLLDNYSIVLTPHMTSPLAADDICVPSEQQLLQGGVYNLGFIAVSATTEAQQFCEWWCHKCATLCFDEFESGLFVDQKWIDLVPTLWGGVYILRHKGYNVAYWNLHERMVNDQVVNNDVPLVFYHFSGIVVSDLNRVSKYQDRFTLDARPDIAPLFRQYRQLLLENDYEKFREVPYAYSCYSNGMVIGPAARRLFSGVSGNYANPFDIGPGSYFELLKKRNLLEKPSCNAQFLKDLVADDKKLLKTKRRVYFFLKLMQKMLGINFYHFIMKAFQKNSAIRKQTFLVE